MKETVVIAIGGNAINKNDQEGTAIQQFQNVREVSNSIANLVEKGYRVVITHGNGPQVGILMMKNEISRGIVPTYPLELCGAQTSGSIGYIIQQCLQNSLKERKIDKQIVTVLTETLIREDDPAFEHPDKPIGPFYSKEQSEALAKEKGYVMAEDSSRGYRRVVPSPMPVDILQKEAISDLTKSGYIVICVGGGGIPVIEQDGFYRGVDAVIDKDRASALLAKEIGADCLIILTGVEKVAIDYGKPTMRNLDSMTPEEARAYMEEGQFPPGSMGPKIQSVCDFLEGGKPGAWALITSLDKMTEAMEGRTGTRIQK